MYRQFETSDKSRSDQPKSAARLLAEAAFAPSARPSEFNDAAPPVVTVINRRLALLSRELRLVSNDAQDVPAASDNVRVEAAATDTGAEPPHTAKAARVFLMPAPGAEPAQANAAMGVTPIETPATSAAMEQAGETAASDVQPFAAPPTFTRRSRAKPKHQHGPVRVIYSAPQALVSAARPVEEAATLAAAPAQLESILVLQQAMADIEALLVDIRFARNFDIGNGAEVPQWRKLISSLDNLSARFPTIG